jgi:Phospholipase_D-nuclease N-terminal
MDIPFNIIGGVLSIAYVWFLVAAIMDCACSKRSDISKINWITFIIVAPIVGPLGFLLFGGVLKKEKKMDTPVYIEKDAPSPRL